MTWTAAPEARIGWATFREAYEQTGVPISTLRYWARQGHVASRLDLTGSSPRRFVALDEVITRMRRRGRTVAGLAPVEAPPPGPPSPPSRSAPPTGRDQRVPEGAMIVPIDAWNKMLNQLGNLHEAGRQLAEARERAARAETEAQFLRERLGELRGELADSKASQVAQRTPPPRWLGIYDRWWRRKS